AGGRAGRPGRHRAAGGGRRQPVIRIGHGRVIAIPAESRLHTVHALARPAGFPRPERQRPWVREPAAATARGEQPASRNGLRRLPSSASEHAVLEPEQGNTVSGPARAVLPVHALAWRAGLSRSQPQRQHQNGARPARHQPELAAVPGDLANLRPAGTAGRRVMSGTVSRGREAGPQAGAQEAAEARGSRGHHRRGGWAAVGLVALAVAGAVSAWRAGAFSSAAASGAGQGAPAPATAAVTRLDLSATMPVTATLGYAGSYTVTGHGGGTLTWLPSAGQVIRQGQVLYKTGNGNPVVLLYGQVPDWRALDEGVTGQDVSQLNHDLVALGDAGSAE